MPSTWNRPAPRQEDRPPQITPMQPSLPPRLTHTTLRSALSRKLIGVSGKPYSTGISNWLLSAMSAAGG